MLKLCYKILLSAMLKLCYKILLSAMLKFGYFLLKVLKFHRFWENWIIPQNNFVLIAWKVWNY